MGWADGHIANLRLGKTVQFRPRGDSMRPRIFSGDLVTVEPVVDDGALAVGEIVLCKVSGAQYLHFIKAVQGPRFQIGNNRGGINGWIGRGGIYGRMIAVERG